MGWIGWSYRDAMATDVNAISMALDSRTELLNQIFGTAKKPDKPPPMTAKSFHDMAKIHNRNWKRKHG